MIKGVTPIHKVETKEEASGTKFCDGDSCEI
jgi:hypothetical protein